MTIKRWMETQNVVCTYNGILSSHEKQWSSVTCYNMNGPWKYCNKWKEPVITRSVPFHLYEMSIYLDCFHLLASVNSVLWTFLFWIFFFKFFYFFWNFWILFYFLYSRFLLVTHFVHISVYMSIPISQFITPPPLPPAFPFGVHTFVLYICVSISVLETGSSVPSF